MSLVVGIAAYSHHVSWVAAIGQLSYPLSNLATSQISNRLKNPKRLELFRTMIGNPLASSLGFLLVGGVLDQYWLNFVISSLGGPILATMVSSNPNLGRVIVLINLVTMSLVAAFCGKTVNWYQFAMFTGFAAMLGVFITQTMDVLLKSLQNEYDRTKALEKIRVAQLELEKRTALREIEVAAKLAASSKLASLGEMAGGVAHEINTPLTTIKLTVGKLQDMVEMDPLDRPQVNRALTQMEATTNRIAKIVHGLRAFSRDGSQDPSVPERVDRIIQSALELCQEKFKENRIDFSVDAPDPSLMVLCRPVEISQVLLNLLNNARDAVAGAQRHVVKIAVRSNENQIEISVTDSGGGIPAELREKIFQPFFTTKEIGKGTGLGLSISKGIIEAHHGSLTLDSSRQETSFVITLPRAKAGPWRNG